MRTITALEPSLELLAECDVSSRIGYWRRRARALNTVEPLEVALGALAELVPVAGADVYLRDKAVRAHGRCARKLMALRADAVWTAQCNPAVRGTNLDPLFAMLRRSADDLVTEAYIDGFASFLRGFFLMNASAGYGRALEFLREFRRRFCLPSVAPLIDGIESHLMRSRIHKQEQLCYLVQATPPPSAMSRDSRRAFAIHYDQIVNNPIEPSLVLAEPEIMELLNGRKDLWDIVAREGKELRQGFDAQHLRLKMEGLRTLRRYYQAKYPERAEKKVLVSGAGPGGLMHALLASVGGFAVQVVEKKSKAAFDPSDQESRRNVLALGKSNMTGHLRTLTAVGDAAVSADIKLMDFVGSLDRVLSEGHAWYERFEVGVAEVSLIHLQNSLIDSLEDLQPGAVCFDSTIESISPEAGIRVRGSDRSEFPSLLVVAEGLGSVTGARLGSTVQGLARPEPMGFSLFAVSKSPGVSMNITGRMSSLWKKGRFWFRRRYDLLPYTDHAALLLSTPVGADLRLSRVQYMYSTLPEAQRKRLKHLRAAGEYTKQCEVVSDLARKYYPALCVWWKEEAVGKLLESHCAITEVLAATVVERSIGTDSYAVVSGDASGTTDPICGAGARTAMIDAALTLRTFVAMEDFRGMSAEVRQVYRSSALHHRELLLRSMREEGLATRHELYKVGSERPERFLQLAVDEGHLTEQDMTDYLLARNEVRIGRTSALEVMDRVLRKGLESVRATMVRPVEESLKRLVRGRDVEDDSAVAAQLLSAYGGGKIPRDVAPEVLCRLRILAARAAQMHWQRETLAGSVDAATAWLLYLLVDRLSTRAPPGRKS